MLYPQISHALSLNDVCDALRLRASSLFTARAARPPAKNTPSHANKVRDCAMAGKLFRAMPSHLQSACPLFVRGGAERGITWRFRRAIRAVDSTTIQLVASCMSWARHRRRKAAARCHPRLNLQSFLPGFAIVDTARQHDNMRARELCAGLLEGEIVIFGKAYVDFGRLWALMQRGIFFVTRSKDNRACRVKKRLPKSSNKRILKDELIVLKCHYACLYYPGLLRRITALVEIDGEERIMVFLTNNTGCAASTACEFYRCRWSIETFFKEVKQTVQLVDFLGRSANAVKRRVWNALLVHLLLRFLAWQSRWAHSFTRLVTYIRAALWLERDVYGLIDSCATANGHFRCLGSPEQAWLPGFARNPMGQPV